jgi:hypothetical protein
MLVMQNKQVNEGFRPKFDTLEEKQKKIKFEIDVKKILEDIGLKEVFNYFIYIL